MRTFVNGINGLLLKSLKGGKRKREGGDSLLY
jgi:hypothetical protein